MRKSKPGAKSLAGTTRTEPFEDKMKGPASKTRSAGEMQIGAEELELQPRAVEIEKQTQPGNLQAAK
jgi:hypothetical protein